MRLRFQFTGTIAGGSSRCWLNWCWRVGWYFYWDVVPTSLPSRAPPIELELEVERASATQFTY